MGKRYYPMMVNDWVHDVGTGMWAAALIVVWRLAALRPAPGGSADVMTAVAVEMFWIMIGSLVVIAVTGGIRLAYWRNENAPDEIPYKRRALLVKHALYFVVYGAGTVWAYFLRA